MATKKKPSAPVKKRSTAPKVFDVARPGQSAASQTSKPVIISNRPVIQDPMVNDTPNDNPVGAPLLKPAKKIVIKPLHDDVVPEVSVPKIAETTPEPITVQVAEPVSEELPQTIAVKTAKPEAEVTETAEQIDEAEETVKPLVEVTQKEPETIAFSKTTTGVPTKNPEVADNQLRAAEATSPTGSPTAAGVPATVRNDKQLTPEQAEAALKASQKRAAELQQVIDKEEYFLPINAVEERRNRRFAILGLLLIIVLGLAWYDTALDAGLVNNTYNLPHSHFFTLK